MTNSEAFLYDFGMYATELWCMTEEEFLEWLNAEWSCCDREPPDAVPVKHGEWEVILAEPWCTFDECKCSVCGVVEYFNKGWKKFNYCPNCGAKMDGERK